MSSTSATTSLPQGVAALRHGHAGALALSALGVVFGDIGTSPLYTLKVVLGASGAQTADRAIVLGSLSLIIWTLVIVTTIKYVGVAMRVDNHGEGGIMALMALLGGRKGLSSGRTKKRALIVTVGLIGAALIYGDGVITPAISVLSALEGLSIVTTSLEDDVVPATVLILVPVFRSAAGHGAHRQIVRADHGHLVSCARRSRPLGICAKSHGPIGNQRPVPSAILHPGG